MRRRPVTSAARGAGITLVYGGGSVGRCRSPRSRARCGGVIGVITEQLMVREVGHPGLTELRVVRTMHERKALMAEFADAFIALPGGFGTFDELCEMATWDQLGIHVKPIALVNIEGYFDGFLAQIDRAVEDRLVKPEHRTMMAVAATIDEALAALAAWQAPEIPKWLQGGTPKP
jgi:uncharacterized protein (TIGR00730 family)